MVIYSFPDVHYFFLTFTRIFNAAAWSIGKSFGSFIFDKKWENLLNFRVFFRQFFVFDFTVLLPKERKFLVLKIYRPVFFRILNHKLEMTRFLPMAEATCVGHIFCYAFANSCFFFSRFPALFLAFLSLLLYFLSTL